MALEALFDLGRHILAKAFATGPAESSQIAEGLTQKGVLSKEEGRTLREMAGDRNRVVHFYHEIGDRELYISAGTAWPKSKGSAGPLASGRKGTPKKSPDCERVDKPSQ